MNNYHPVDFDEVVEHFFQLGKVPKTYDGGGGDSNVSLGLEGVTKFSKAILWVGGDNTLKKILRASRANICSFHGYVAFKSTMLHF